MVLIDYFRILKALIILFLLYICMNYVPNQNVKVQEETLADSNSDAVKTTLRLYTISKWPSLFFKFFKNFFPFLCHFVTYNRKYYEWLCRLRCHIQVVRLPVQGTWLGLVTLSVIWGSMWPTLRCLINGEVKINKGGGEGSRNFKISVNMGNEWKKET